MITGSWIVKGLREFTLGGYEKASKSFTALPDITKTSVLITGSNSGIGLAAAKQLAKRGATVHLACRNEERAEKAKTEILEEHPSSNVFVHLLDISKLPTIKPFVEKLSQDYQIDTLVNNAGCMVHGTDSSKRLTAQNFEVNCATNTIGTYILTKAFLSLPSTPSKIITVSSGGMYTEKLNPNFGMSPTETLPEKPEKSGPYIKDATQVYAQNKRQQVVFMEELTKKYQSTEFSTMHPGWAETEAVKNSMPDFHKKMEGKWRSPDQGADTIVYLGLEKVESGKFWLDRKPVSTKLLIDCRGGDNQSNRDVLMKNLDSLYAEF